MDPAYSKYEDYIPYRYAAPSYSCRTANAAERGVFVPMAPDHTYHGVETALTDRYCAGNDWQMEPPRPSPWMPMPHYDHYYKGYYYPRPSMTYQYSPPLPPPRYQYISPPSGEYYPSPQAFMPFYQGDQFWHLYHYPVGPDSEQHRPSSVNHHCCGCPNHVCHAASSAWSENEKNIALDANEERGVGNMKMQVVSPAPTVWFAPGTYEKDKKKSIVAEKGKEKDGYQEADPAYWLPFNWPSNSRKDSKEGGFKWIPLDSFLKKSEEEESSKLESLPSIFFIPPNIMFGGEDAKNQQEKPKAKDEDFEHQEEGNQGNGTKEENEMLESSTKTSSAAVKARDIPLKLQNMEEKEKALSSSAAESVQFREVPLEKMVSLETQKVEAATGETKSVEEDSQKRAATEKPNESDVNKQTNRQIQSETQAATMIQATYRGYLVRKLQPIKKLQKIMKIRSRIAEIQQQINGSAFEKLMVENPKTKARVSETIMSQLLQLDTIQGLHPDVREVRKSVARELTKMQEKLDVLGEQVIAEVVKEDAAATEQPTEEEKEMMTTSLNGNISGVKPEMIENGIQKEKELNEDPAFNGDREAKLTNALDTFALPLNHASQDNIISDVKHDTVAPAKESNNDGSSYPSQKTAEISVSDQGGSKSSEIGHTVTEGRATINGENCKRENDLKLGEETSREILNRMEERKELKNAGKEEALTANFLTYSAENYQKTEAVEAEAPEGSEKVSTEDISLLFCSENGCEEEKDKATADFSIPAVKNLEEIDNQAPATLMQIMQTNNESSLCNVMLERNSKECEQTDFGPIGMELLDERLKSRAESSNKKRLPDQEIKDEVTKLQQLQGSAKSSAAISASRRQEENFNGEKSKEVGSQICIKEENQKNIFATEIEIQNASMNSTEQEGDAAQKENEQLKKRLEEILQAGKKQTETILHLYEKIWQLEEKLNVERSKQGSRKSSTTPRFKNGFRIKRSTTPPFRSSVKLKQSENDRV